MTLEVFGTYPAPTLEPPQEIKDKDALFKQWLTDKLAESKKSVRGILYKMAQIRFSVVVGQTWFTEFSTIEENSMDIDGVNASVDMNEIQVEI